LSLDSSAFPLAPSLWRNSGIRGRARCVREGPPASAAVRIGKSDTAGV